MKSLLLIFGLLVPAFAQCEKLELISHCVRADSGDHPEVHVYAGKNDNGLLVFSAINKAIYTVPTSIFEDGATQRHFGEISVDIATQGEGRDHSDAAEISFSSDNENFKGWLQKTKSMELEDDETSISFKCKVHISSL